MSVDLRAYAERIEYTGAWTPTLETLRGLHLAHVTHIPFENLDILLGRPILLDLESVSAKLIHARRGGYCFEQNALFGAVLESIGFRVTRLAARVSQGANKILSRTHMLLQVDVTSEAWLADVGFGGDGLLYPVPIKHDEVARQFGWQYRMLIDGGTHVLQSLAAAGWSDLYAFTLEPQEPVDYEVSNYYTSTHPRSGFVQKLVAQRPGTHSRWTLMNRLLKEQTPDGVTETTLADDDEVLEALADRFSLRFPAGTRFPYQES